MVGWGGLVKFRKYLGGMEKDVARISEQFDRYCTIAERRNTGRRSGVGAKEMLSFELEFL